MTGRGSLGLIICCDGAGSGRAQHGGTNATIEAAIFGPKRLPDMARRFSDDAATLALTYQVQKSDCKRLAYRAIGHNLLRRPSAFV